MLHEAVTLAGRWNHPKNLLAKSCFFFLQNQMAALYCSFRTFLVLALQSNFSTSSRPVRAVPKTMTHEVQSLIRKLIKNLGYSTTRPSTSLAVVWSIDLVLRLTCEITTFMKERAPCKADHRVGGSLPQGGIVLKSLTAENLGSILH